MKKKICIIIVLLVISISLFADLGKELDSFVGKKVEVYLKNSSVSFKGILKSFDKNHNHIVLIYTKSKKKLLIYGDSIVAIKELDL